MSNADTVASAGPDPAERSAKGAAERATAQHADTVRVCVRCRKSIPVAAGYVEDLLNDVFLCEPCDQWHCFNCGNDLPCPAHSDGDGCDG